VLVNNAGTYYEGPFSELQEAHLDSMLEVNVRAPIMLTRMLLDQIKAGESSLVVNISSVQASRPSENLAAYAGTKAALSAYSAALRKELNPLGIRVTTIEPSSVNTWSDPDPKQLLDPKDVAELVRMIVTQDPAVQIDEISISGI
jgi:NADP-dependent 3-hydroxy acid dehydrogenase YdfG